MKILEFLVVIISSAGLLYLLNIYKYVEEICVRPNEFFEEGAAENKGDTLLWRTYLISTAALTTIAIYTLFFLILGRR